MSKQTGLADALRSGTHQNHKDVEKAPKLKGIFSESFSIDDYAVLIGRWRSFFETLDPCLTDVAIGEYRYRPRLPALQADYLSLDRIARPVSPFNGEGRWTPGDYESSVGACYVIEGSCLGAKLICKRLNERLGPLIVQSTHFYSIEFKRWHWFRSQLNIIEEKALVNPAKVIAGARDCFRAIELVMS